MSQSLFFCGIGGSGMLPLAMIAKNMGYQISGSDRSYDQKRNVEKFEWLLSQNITLYPQDGSGITKTIDEIITSTAVEATIPDIKAAMDHNVTITHRAAFLARLFNAKKERIAIAGTSGKSTITAMLAFILYHLNQNPSVMNGAVMTDFVTSDNPYASALTGQGDIFVTEADESDGSFLNYKPTIGLISNIALDHKGLDELHGLFDEFVMRCSHVIVNADHPETLKLSERYEKKISTYSIHDFDNIVLKVPGQHNISNAAAALSIVKLLGLDVEEAKKCLADFSGTKRRLETVGEANNITVIDDFAHNPDKIMGSLSALKELKGRLIVLYQPHGFGMLKLTGQAMGQAFANALDEHDQLFVTQPLYLGGTTDRSIGAEIIANEVKGSKVFDDKQSAFDTLIKDAKPHDRIVIMGARDDTLTQYAQSILKALC